MRSYANQRAPSWLDHDLHADDPFGASWFGPALRLLGSGCALRGDDLTRWRDVSKDGPRKGFRRSFTFSRRISPELCGELPPSKRTEGAGNAGCTLHPRSRVQVALKESAHEHTGEAEAVRHPLREWFDGLYRALLGDRAFLPPSPRGSAQGLAPASGRRDHTASPYARCAVRLSARPRPPHSAPRFLAIAIRPSGRGGTVSVYTRFEFL